MLLNVLVQFRHAYGAGERLEQRDIVSIKATTQQGRGNCIVYYRAKDAAGAWFNFNKKDNPGARLPVIKDFHRKLVDVQGVRGIYELESDEVPLD